MARAKLKAASLVLLVAALVLAGGMVTYHLLVPRPIEKTCGSEADARRCAEQRVREVAAARQAAIPGWPELRQQILSSGSGPAARRHGIVSVKAELDRKSGQWTVIGAADALVGEHPPGRAWDWKVVEIEWKVVVWYVPSTNAWSAGDVAWSAGDGVLLAPDGE